MQILTHYVTILGCTDINALNYDSIANVNDGSCVEGESLVYGCQDPSAYNYNPNANISDEELYPCEPVIVGCTNSLSLIHI